MKDSNTHCSFMPVVNDEHVGEEWLRSARFADSAIMMLEHSIHRGLDRGLIGKLPVALVVWSMLRWEQKLGVTMLKQTLSNFGAFESDVEALLHVDELLPMLYVANIDKVACAAKRESERLGHQHVGTEHLILAVLSVGDDEIQELMSRHNVTRDDLERALREIISSSQEGP